MANSKALQVVEYKKQRILTTEQLAKAYGTSPNTIIQNFNRNKRHYVEGKYYFFLEGEPLKIFLESIFAHDKLSSTKIRNLYLWTEKGALMHANSLATPEAKQIYQTLIDTYYQQKEALEEKQKAKPEPPRPEVRLIGPPPSWVHEPPHRIANHFEDRPDDMEEARALLEQYITHRNEPLSLAQLRKEPTIKAIPLKLLKETLEDMADYGTIDRVRVKRNLCYVLAENLLPAGYERDKSLMIIDTNEDW